MICPKCKFEQADRNLECTRNYIDYSEGRDGKKPQGRNCDDAGLTDFIFHALPFGTGYLPDKIPPEKITHGIRHPRP